MKFFMWLGIGVFTVPLRGFVFQTMWRWFVVPFGIVGLTLAQAIGLMIFVHFLTMHVDLKEKSKDEEAKEIVAAFVIPLWWWAIAWIVQMFL